MKTHSLTYRIGMLSFLACISLTACTKEKKVFVDRPFFDDPPTAAQGFLGFDNADTKMTVCGNCHIGQQTKWAATGHAGAWKSLQDSGHAAAYCEGCHSVGGNGNSTSGAVGYAGVADKRYEDVQCESCHGPGLSHVENPDLATTRPRGSIKILDDAGNPTLTCAECHTGVHNPFAEEWAQSKHARVEPEIASRLVTNPSGTAVCEACHTAQGVLTAWGVTDNYKEKSDPPASHMGITCAVCHDPHAKDHEGQLRFPIDVPDENVNLCMKCHHKRAQPEVTATTVRGPHSPEGPLLLGEAGWWPPGFKPEIDRIVATHGTTGNPRLCAGCHVSSFNVTDPATGAFVFRATGHLFNAIPCIGPDGKPTPDEECDVNARSFKACANSGCHSNEASAKGAFTTAKARMASLTAEVDRLLTIPPASTALNLTDGTFTVADGAWFNSKLGQLPGTPIHNPFLIEQLLIASIQAVKTTYGVQSSETVPLERQFR